MEKQYSIISLIKNKTITLMILFLIKITRTLRVSALAWYVGGRLSYRHAKALLNFASGIQRYSIRLLQFITTPAQKRGN